MRKTVKIGVILLVIGVIMVIFGIANNGIQSIYWEKGFHLFQTQEKTYHPNKITNVTLSTNDDVVIKRGDTATVHVVSAHKLPTVTTTNGHVTVSSKSNGRHTTEYMFADPAASERIVITVPAKTTIDWIRDTDDHDGDVTIQNVTVNHVALQSDHNTVALSNVNVNKSTQFAADTLRLTHVNAPSVDVTGGDVTINQSRFNQGTSKITSDDGDLNISQTQFKSGEVHTDDGDIHLVQNHVERLNASTDDGDIRLTTSKRSGVYAQTMDGDLNIFGYRSDSGSPYRYQQTAAQQYHLSSQDGDVTATAA